VRRMGRVGQIIFGEGVRYPSPLPLSRKGRGESKAISNRLMV